MINFTYMFLLLSMLIIIINGIILCFKYAPLKIKILSITLLFLLACRYITLIIFSIHRSINYLYSLRILYFINILCIPIIAFIVLYILSRNDRIKFKLIIISSLILALLFSLLIIKVRINLILSSSFVYTAGINYLNFINIFYLIINILSILASIFILNKSKINKLNINKRGIILILLASIVVIIEILLGYTKIALLPEKILGDILWVFSLNYSLYELKK